MDTYFTVKASLLVDGQRIDFQQELACEHDVERYSIDGFKRHDTWSESRFNLYHELPNDEVVLLLVPRVCNTRGPGPKDRLDPVPPGFIPSVLLLKKDRGSFEYYYAPAYARAEQSRVKPLSFEVTSSSGENFRHDEKYSSFAFSFDMRLEPEDHYYGTLVAFIYPESVWSEVPEFRVAFKDLKETTIIRRGWRGVNTSKVSSLRKGLSNGFWSIADNGFNVDEDYAYYYAHSTRQVGEGKWEVEHTPGILYFTRYGRSLDEYGTRKSTVPGTEHYGRNIQVCYKGKCLDFPNERVIYDPKEQELIAVMVMDRAMRGYGEGP